MLRMMEAVMVPAVVVVAMAAVMAGVVAVTVQVMEVVAQQDLPAGMHGTEN
jgi:hypothetical protein